LDTTPTVDPLDTTSSSNVDPSATDRTDTTPIDSNVRDTKRTKTDEPMLLSVKHAHDRDRRVVFEEVGHVYNVDWYDDGVFTSLGIMSSTSLYKPYFEEFDSDVVIANMRARRMWSKSKYFGLSNEQIKERWVEAAIAGGRHHLLCENYYNGIPPPSPYA